MRQRADQVFRAFGSGEKFGRIERYDEELRWFVPLARWGWSIPRMWYCRLHGMIVESNRLLLLGDY
jgi:hypothetical protein